MDEAQLTEAKAEQAGDPSANVEPAPLLDSCSSRLPTPAPSGEGESRALLLAYYADGELRRAS